MKRLTKIHFRRKAFFLQNLALLYFVYSIYQNYWCKSGFMIKWKFFGAGNLELFCLDTDAFRFSFEPFKGLFEELKHFREDFGFGDLDPSHAINSEEF